MQTVCRLLQQLSCDHIRHSFPGCVFYLQYDSRPLFNDSSCSMVWCGARVACAEVSTGSVEASNARLRLRYRLAPELKGRKYITLVQRLVGVWVGVSMHRLPACTDCLHGQGSSLQCLYKVISSSTIRLSEAVRLDHMHPGMPHCYFEACCF
jgi:hypothetical protein